MKKFRLVSVLFALLFASGIHAQDPFITTWRTTTANESITIPTFSGETYNYDVDWGDGTTSTNQIFNASHTYTSPGDYSVSISGTFPRIHFYLNDFQNRGKIRSVDQWGDQIWTSMERAFWGCRNVAGQAVDTPNLSLVTSCRQMFDGARLFNQDIGGWDVSSIVDMLGMFSGALSFNQDISSWDVSNVEIMFNMFRGFGGTSTFNQDISSWDVSNVQTMSGMFREANAFNQDISNWDVSSVESFTFMFAYSDAFNQDISSWDVSGALYLGAMFRDNDSFNQDISSWDVSNVMNAVWMFDGASSFNQDLSTWNVINMTTMSDMFKDSGLSSDNYDSILIGWGSQNVQTDVLFHGGDAMYCAGSNARDILINNFNWTITDAGLDSTCNFCSISDTIPPNALCLNQTVYLDSTNQVVLDALQIDDGSFDQCGIDTMFIYPNIFDCSHIGQNAVNLVVVDSSGFINTCEALVVVLELENPNITCPADVTFNTDTVLCVASNINYGQATAVDNCTLLPFTNNAPDTFLLGLDTIVWSVSDFSGNVATCEQKITIVDNEDPTIICPIDITVVADSSSCFATNVVLGSSITDDNCSVSQVTNNAPNSFPLGQTSVRWKVVDSSGNQAICFQSVTVIDIEKPTILCPLDITVDANEGVCTASSVALGSPIVYDNCSVASVTNNAPAVYQLGTKNVRWKVIDGSGNERTCIQKVMVIDTENPTIICPSDMTVSADAGQCVATNVNLTMPMTSDNCQVESVNHNGPLIYNIGATSVDWTVTDAAGNAATCVQLVIVIDAQNPTINCPSDVTTTTDAGLCSAVVAIGDPLVSDNCQIANYVNNAPNTFLKGQTQVDWTLYDQAGNESSCQQSITVFDGESPVAGCQDVTIYLDENGMAALAAEQLNNNSTDNCGIASMSLSQNNFDCSDLGSQFIDLIVTDAAGNISSCQSEVTVIDPIDPIVSCMNYSVLLDENGVATISPSDIFNGTMDNCGQTTFSLSLSTFDCSDIGLQQVTLTMSAIGYTDSCTASILVQDVFGHCCPNTLFVSQNPIPNGTFYANQKIATNSVVPINGNVIFNAGNQVDLAPAFRVDASGRFRTESSGCN